MSIEFDFTELDRLEASYVDVPARTKRNVRQAVQVTARGIKDDWKAVARPASGGHARAYPNAITYDMKADTVFGVDVIRAEIGPELGRAQGRLGFLEEGVASQNTGAQNASKLAVRANQDDFVRGVLMAAATPED